MASVLSDPVENALILVQTDRATGLAALKTLAEAGDLEATAHFAMYLSEETPATDEAVTWLERAAALGFADAAWNLAMVAHERSNSQAVRHWIDESARLGSDDAVLVQRRAYDVDEVLRMWSDPTWSG